MSKGGAEMEENKKQFNWKTFIIVLMAVLLAFSLYKIATLSDEIDHLKSRNSNLTGDIQILREEINSIYDNVDKQLKKQASLISGVDFSIGNPSEDMKTVELSLTVVPKLISDDMQISVTVDGVTAPLERNGNEFKGTIDVGLFIDYNQWPLLSIKTAEGTKTEYLEDVDVSYMFSRHLPSLYADMSGGSGKFSDGTLSVDLGFTVETKPASQNAPITFTSFTSSAVNVVKSCICTDVNHSLPKRTSFNAADIRPKAVLIVPHTISESRYSMKSYLAEYKR